MNDSQASAPEGEPATTAAAGSEPAGAVVESPSEDGETARPRRRGHRGGRRRKAASGSSEADASQTAAGEPEASPESGIAPDLAEGPPAAGGEEPARPRRRRRGGRRHKGARDEAAASAAAEGAASSPEESAAGEAPVAEQPLPEAGAAAEAAARETASARRRRRSTSRRKTADEGLSEAAAAQEPAATADAEAAPAAASAAEPGAEQAPQTAAKRPRRRRASRKQEPAQAGADGAEASASETAPSEPGAQFAEEPSPAPKKARRRSAAKTVQPVGPAEALEAGEGVPQEQPPAEAPPPKKARRRRSTAKTAEVGERAAEEQPPAEPAAPGEPSAAAQRPAEGRTRRRRQGRREAAPAERAGRERVILASEDYGELRVVLLEDGRLAEVYFQRPERPSYLGNIYRAKVESVLRGMDAAFIDFGLEKNGFLHVDEVSLPENGGGRRGKRITQLLQGGQDLLVQVTKDPMGSKGARLTTRMSLAGRYLVYVPGGSGVGVSRRLPQQERDRLRDVCRELKPKDAGVIVRTVAEGKGLDEIRRDLQYLARLWTRIKTKAEKAPVPGLVHEEVDVALSVARDLFDESVARFVVDTAKLRKELIAYLERVAPELVDRVELYRGEEPLFDEHGIEEQLERTLQRRVPLPSGGNIVIDHAEALTVVDVNSGKYTGGSGLEDTITKTNLEAATEVVRQLRLRDIGGIIVIDFIDMERAENRGAVLGKLEAELATDRTKTYVVEISPLGLVEMTRQNTTDGARGILTQACPLCSSSGRVPSEDTIARRVERRLRQSLSSSRAAAVLIEVNGGVAARLNASDRIRKLEREMGKRFLFQGSRSLPTDAYEVVAQGTLKEMEAQRLPVGEGDEVEVDLEHSLTFSPKDALATVEGYPIVVKNGRPFLGNRRRVRVETTLRTGGTAVLLAGGGAP